MLRSRVCVHPSAYVGLQNVSSILRCAVYLCIAYTNLSYKTTVVQVILPGVDFPGYEVAPRR